MPALPRGREVERRLRRRPADRRPTRGRRRTPSCGAGGRCPRS
jgi:hypothetical protein